MTDEAAMPESQPLLESIAGPDDLSGLDDAELAQVAQEVRELIIDTIGEIGGHFGANLGTCELTTVLHSLLDSPRDKILWDVGHQAYPHKILTGRAGRLETIRQYEGLAPFCSVFESEHDIMGAGHASTSIGYAVGLKEAMRHGIGEDGKVVAVIGDGALTGGVAFEALHNAGGLQTPIVIVLNDNGMSISPNVGALSRLFQRTRLNPRLYHAREDVEGALTKLPLGLGRQIEKIGPEIKSAIKAYAAPGLLFEELDLAYVGPIDGHDVTELRDALEPALAADRPVVVHIQTVKGKGFEPAEEGGLEGMEKWHAAKPGSIVERQPAPKKAAPKTPLSREEMEEAQRPAEPEPPAPPPAYTAVFGDALVVEAKRDPRVIGITAAMAGGTGLTALQAEVPERYYDVGIAEQDAVLFAAGLAIQGAKPVCAIYSTFLQRAYDQLVHDVCLQKLNVVFAMDRAGLVGDDGPTHHGAFDISYFRSLPNVVVMAPRDEAMLVHMLRTALAYDDGPVAFRYPRGTAEGVPLPERAREIPIGTGEVLKEGTEGGPGRLRLRRHRRARRGGAARRARPCRDGRRRPLREAARRAAAGAARRRARARGHDRGERPRRRLRLRGARAPRGRVRRCRPGAGESAPHRDAGPLRHPRQAGAPSRGGRAHGPRGRRAGDRRARRAAARVDSPLTLP